MQCKWLKYQTFVHFDFKEDENGKPLGNWPNLKYLSNFLWKQKGRIPSSSQILHSVFLTNQAWTHATEWKKKMSKCLQRSHYHRNWCTFSGSNNRICWSLMDFNAPVVFIFIESSQCSWGDTIHFGTIEKDILYMLGGIYCLKKINNHSIFSCFFS